MTDTITITLPRAQADALLAVLSEGCNGALDQIEIGEGKRGYWQAALAAGNEAQGQIEEQINSAS